ncbi:MAG TPA: o-succinylbenzoate synthase [Pyrinomonadaceae bacterium]|nr:o-succinylbenzoate synthase [Pyrinomonadaceae bacterium]
MPKALITQEISLRTATLHRVRVPLIEPFRISNGAVVEKDVIVVQVTTEEGITGWGEASPMGGTFYSSDTPESTWQDLETLIPLVLSTSTLNVPMFYHGLRNLPGSPFAKAGIEGALWDAYAHTAGAPLCELFGGRARPIASGVAIGICDEIEELLVRVERYTAEGYQRVKIKIQPGWDLEPVTAVRTRFPNVPLMADANAAYTFADVEMFRELDSFGLMMIEQPFARDAHDEAAELQRQLRTPLCADESAESLQALDSLIRKQAARIINIKVQRVGGLSEACQMLKTALKAGLECWVGTMPELGIASAQGLQFAALDEFAYPTDIEASARWYVDDLVEPAIEIDSHGFIHLPSGPGTGYRISREKLEQYSVREKTFSA